MNIFKLLAVIISLNLTPMLFGSETDNFTLRNSHFNDSTIWLNDKMNSSLATVAKSTKSCDRFELHKKLYKELGGVFFAKIEKWSNLNPDAQVLPIEKSIYANVSNVRGTHGLRKLFKFHSYYTSGQFKVNDVIAGDDKLGHFLQLGYGMYFAVQKKTDNNFLDIRTPSQKLAELMAHDYHFLKENKETNPLDIVASFANFQEDGEWGMTATLVKSYGDMAADYSGYLFWSELTEGKNPYFICKDNHFTMDRQFHWEDYIDASWDESINCSDFHPSIDKDVKDQIEQRGMGQCPVDKFSCAALVKKFGPIANRFLHPNCYKAGLEILNNNKIEN